MLIEATCGNCDHKEFFEVVDKGQFVMCWNCPKCLHSNGTSTADGRLADDIAIRMQQAGTQAASLLGKDWDVSVFISHQPTKTHVGVGEECQHIQLLQQLLACFSRLDTRKLNKESKREVVARITELKEIACNALGIKERT